MRDGTVLALHEQNARREGLILAQFEFIKTRLDALETVGRFSSLKDRVRWVFQPALFLERVDAVQQALLVRAQAAMDEARAKPRIIH